MTTTAPPAWLPIVVYGTAAVLLLVALAYATGTRPAALS